MRGSISYTEETDESGGKGTLVAICWPGAVKDSSPRPPPDPPENSDCAGKTNREALERNGK